MESRAESPTSPAILAEMAAIDSRAEIAQAKAEMAVVLSDSFREDINSLRLALRHANQLIATLQAENASIRAALTHANPAFDFATLRPDPKPCADADAVDDADDDDDDNDNPAGTPSSRRFAPRIPPVFPPRPDMQRPPPEGTIFSNGGPYSSSRKGERSIYNKRLKKELNDWTRLRGYTVKIYRSRLEKKRAKLIISCGRAGRPKKVRSEEEEQQLLEQAHEGGPSFRKQRVSKLSDCPLKFSLLEIVEGSGTFAVKHALDSGAQHCNHGPDPVLESDVES